MHPEIFISYVQPNRNVAFAIHDAIQLAKIKSWIATSQYYGIPSGKYFDEEIAIAIKNCRVFVFVYSAYSNISTEAIKEVRNAQGKIIIVVRLDSSDFTGGLSYHFKGLQYIDAIGDNLPVAIQRLLLDLQKITGNALSAENLSTDKILLNNGIKLAKDKLYKEATDILSQYVAIDPFSIEARFYLAISLLGGKRPKKLDGLYVKKIENILLPCIKNQTEGHTRVLLAILKFGYYYQNGFIETTPDSEQLLTPPLKISKEKAGEILFHLHDPENDVWSLIYNFYHS
jgi:hypothetical protein